MFAFSPRHQVYVEFCPFRATIETRKTNSQYLNQNRTSERNPVQVNLHSHLRTASSTLRVNGSSRPLPSVMLMAVGHCQPFKVSQTADCLVAQARSGIFFPVLALNQAGRVAAINVTSPTARSVRPSPAAVQKQAGGGTAHRSRW